MLKMPLAENEKILQISGIIIKVLKNFDFLVFLSWLYAILYTLIRVTVFVKTRLWCLRNPGGNVAPKPMRVWLNAAKIDLILFSIIRGNIYDGFKSSDKKHNHSD